MAASQPAQTKTNHPVLGPAIAIDDDTRRTKLRLIFEICMVPLGLFGAFLGRGDLASGDAILGLSYAAGGVVLALYGVRGSVLDAQHLASPIRLLVARDGFELFPGNRLTSWWEAFPSRRPISWNEVSTIGDMKYPNAPRALRLQIDDPSGFADRQALGPIARIMLRINRGDLVLGTGMATSIPRTEGIMRRHLIDFRGGGPASARAPARPRTPQGRRRSRKR
ncbi:MAG: hypothetical protein ACHQ01_06000 [Candidatus Limnocylindrales bacterium]